MFENHYVRITNNFLHDMATGTWAACVLVLVLLHRDLAGLPAESAAALGGSMRAVWWLLVGALVVLTVTGALRLFYWRATTLPAELAQKRLALIVKHVAFLVVYGGGSLFAYFLVPFAS